MKKGESNKDRYEECKQAAEELFNSLEKQNIQMVGCGISWNDDGTDFEIGIVIHHSEKNKNHTVPTTHRTFNVTTEYADYGQFA